MKSIYDLYAIYYYILLPSNIVYNGDVRINYVLQRSKEEDKGEHGKEGQGTTRVHTYPYRTGGRQGEDSRAYGTLTTTLLRGAS